MPLRLIKRHANKVYGEGCTIASNLASPLDGDEWSASLTGHLTPGEGPLTSIKHDAGWNLEPDWMLYKGKNPLPLPGIKPWFLGCPVGSVITILTKLSELNQQVIHFNLNISAFYPTQCTAIFSMRFLEYKKTEDTVLLESWLISSYRRVEESWYQPTRLNI